MQARFKCVFYNYGLFIPFCLLLFFADFTLHFYLAFLPFVWMPFNPPDRSFRPYLVLHKKKEIKCSNCRELQRSFLRTTLHDTQSSFYLLVISFCVLITSTCCEFNRLSFPSPPPYQVLQYQLPIRSTCRRDRAKSLIVPGLVLLRVQRSRPSLLVDQNYHIGTTPPPHITMFFGG